MQGGDVLERDENVAVQLDVRDVLDVAVGREDALLVLAAEECDLDLLTLVLVRVVLHETQSIRRTAAVRSAGPPRSIGADPAHLCTHSYVGEG